MNIKKGVDWDSKILNIKNNIDYLYSIDHEQYSKLKDIIIKAEEIYIELDNLYTLSIVQNELDIKNQYYKENIIKIDRMYDLMSRKMSMTNNTIFKNKERFLKEISNDEQLYKLKPYYKNLLKESYLEEEICERFDLVNQYNNLLYENDTIGEFKYKGKNYQITPNKLISYLGHPDRHYRRIVYETVLDFYKNLEKKASFLINTNYQMKNLVAKNLGFNNYIKFILKDHPFKGSRIDIFENIELIQGLFKKNLEIRRKLLSLDSISYFDLYYMGEQKSYITFEEAKALIIESSKVYGYEYVNELSNFFESENIYYESNSKKKFGARSYSSFKGYPYIIMNWNNDIESLFILAHEVGGAMSQYFAKNNNSIVYSEPSELKIEVSSILNELLLWNYLKDNNIKSIKNKELDIKMLEIFKDSYFVPMENITILKDLIIQSENNILDEISISEIYTNIIKRFRFCDKFEDLKTNRINWIKLHDQLNLEYNIYYLYAFIISINIESKSIYKLLEIFKKGELISDFNFCKRIVKNPSYVFLKDRTDKKVENTMNIISRRECYEDR